MADRIVWSEERLALLGTMPDIQVAQKVGCSLPAVAYQRRVRGVAPYQSMADRILWSDDRLALLGTMPDRKIAMTLGCSESAVARQRLLRGVAPYRYDAPKTDAAPDHIEIDAELRAQLDELAASLVPRYVAAGLPVQRLEHWQVVRIAVADLLQATRRAQAKAGYATTKAGRSEPPPHTV